MQRKKNHAPCCLDQQEAGYKSLQGMFQFADHATASLWLLLCSWFLPLLAGESPCLCSLQIIYFHITSARC